MIDLKKSMIWTGLLSGIAIQFGTQTIAEEWDSEAETIEVVEAAELYQADPAVLFRAEAASVLAILALKQEASLRQSTMTAYGQLVSELEMYDDRTRVVDTSGTDQEPGSVRANFMPST